MKDLSYINLESQKFILENKGLVHHIVQKNFKIPTNATEYDDITSIGMMGLIKAALKYDESKGTKFSTFAGTCIMNEIRMSFRKSNKYAFDKSLEENVYRYENNTNKINRNTSYEEIIEDTRYNTERDVIINEEVVEVLNIIFNCFKARDLIILLYEIAGAKHEYSAKILNISISYVSRIKNKALKKVRRIMLCGEKYEKIFFISKEDDTYYIKFSSKDIENWDIVWKKIQIKIEREKPHNLHIKDKEGKITVKAYLYDFLIVVEIFRIILQIP